MFMNGLFLGMIWGLVFSYMEGRRVSEVLGAVLCASFIVSSGAVKSVGVLLMQDLACTGILDAGGHRARVHPGVVPVGVGAVVAAAAQRSRTKRSASGGRP